MAKGPGVSATFRIIAETNIQYYIKFAAGMQEKNRGFFRITHTFSIIKT